MEIIISQQLLFNKQKLIIKEGNIREFLILDDAFHEIIFKSLGKERTWQAIEHMNSQFKRVRILWLLLTTTTDWEEILGEHEGLFTALKKRDAYLAQKLMKEHLTKAVIHMGEIKAKHPDYFKS